MIVAGCDIGSLTAKAVIMKNSEVLGYAVIRAKTKPVEFAEEVMRLALEQADGFISAGWAPRLDSDSERSDGTDHASPIA